MHSPRAFLARSLTSLPTAALLLAVAFAPPAHASTSSGDEFILTWLPNPAAGPPVVEVQLTAAVATTVTVEHPVLSPTFTTSVAVTPGSTTTVALPAAASTGWVVDTVMNNAVRLSAADPFIAHLVNRKGATSDGALGIPVDALGLEYYAADYDPPSSNPGGQLAVVATVDGTTVTITPSVALAGGHPAGVPFNVALDRGEAYFGQTTTGSSVGLSGTRVVADNPVCLSNGAYCLNVPTTTPACDHIFEVAPPVQAWRTSYLAANLPSRPAGTIYRILAATNSTAVTVDGLPVTGSPIDAGELLEVGPLTGNHVIEGSEPILVAQYVTGSSSPGTGGAGDPAMCNLVATDQFQTDTRFSTFLGGAWGVPSLVEHYLIVFALDADTASITLNSVPIGATSFSSIPGTGHSVATLNVAAGTYRTESSSGHGVLVVGLSNGPEAYSYPGGTALAPLAPLPCMPDGLDGGPCCSPAQPTIQRPKPFTHDALAICWRDCDVESTAGCIAEWSLGSTNLAPCAVRRMQLVLRDPASAAIKWRGRITLQYSRTWREDDGSGNPLQVWRWLANGDLRRTSATGPAPCPVPPCAASHAGRVRYTGYVDMARPCGATGSSAPPPQFAWMLHHACDSIDHVPGFARGGTFHPDRSYTLVGPSAGFVPTPLQAVESGTSTLDAVRAVDLSGGAPRCLYEEPIDLVIDPVTQSCACGGPGPDQLSVANLSLTGACGTSASVSPVSLFPGFLSMSIGTWTDPTTYPGLEGLRWNAGGYGWDDCFGVFRDEVFFGVTTLGGNDAFTIPSPAGSIPVPLPRTFVDQHNALRSGAAVVNVPWKRSDRFLQGNLP